MANRRMFNKEVVNSDAFTSMPISSQALYFHLGMEADDDGFVNNPVRVARTINVSSDDLKVLVLKKFVIDFGDGVVVIKHWRKNNQLRYDRYKGTNYEEQANQLYIKKDGTYTLNADNIGVIPFMATKIQPNSNQNTTQYSIGKVSVVESSIEKESKEKDSSSKNIDKPTTDNQDLSFIESLNKDVTKSTIYETLERKIQRNLVKRTLTDIEAKMLFDWINSYPSEYLSTMIEKISLGSDDKKNFRYLNGAIVRAYPDWKDKPVDKADNDIDAMIDELYKEKK